MKIDGIKALSIEISISENRIDPEQNIRMKKINF